ncbi:MAG: formyltetrahydrofolate deformylase [Acidimicrobiia bacterium]
MRPPRAVLLLSCPDARGIVRSVAEFVERHNGNIVDAEQHTDIASGVFFQRVEFDLDGFDLDRREILPAFDSVRERFAMDVAVKFTDERLRIALLASKQGHCLHDLLVRWKAGEIDADVRAVIANHPDHADFCRFVGVAHHHLPVTPGHRAEQEAQVRAVLEAEQVDLVVLARYMQILSPELCAAYPNRIINIHHSFLPAFVGAKPYHQAYERGVKLIGVTAHYVTADLDQGPIIEQDVARASHRDGADDLVRRGRDLETIVLARAVRAHLEHRVLVYGAKTVVFG